MDPISTAIIAAIASGLTQVSIIDAYNGIKHLIQSKYDNKDMIDAINKLEQKPDSKARQMELQEQVEACHLHHDDTILESANNLLAVMKPLETKTHIMIANGHCIGQADHGSTVNVIIGK